MNEYIDGVSWYRRMEREAYDELRVVGMSG